MAAIAAPELSPHIPTDAPPALEALAADLKVLLKAGLPVTPRSAGRALLSLRSVWARAVDPRDPLARVDALNRLVRHQLRKMRKLGHKELNAAPEILFGLGDGAGLNLTNRRIKAASNVDYDHHHFRKRIEPRLVEQLAWQLYQDGLQYLPRGRRTPPAAASGDTPTITEEDVSDPERAEHEILLSRIWSGVYALRADLLTREQQRGNPDAKARFDEADRRCRRTLGELLLDLDEYLERWGERILHGEAEYNADGLIRLAGWTGELTDDEARELRWQAARARSTGSDTKAKRSGPRSAASTTSRSRGKSDAA